MELVDLRLRQDFGHGHGASGATDIKNMLDRASGAPLVVFRPARACGAPAYADPPWRRQFALAETSNPSRPS